MATYWYNEKIRRPLISFTETLMKGAGGFFREKDEYVPFMYRALVIGVDVYGGKLETPDGKPEGGAPAMQRVQAAGVNIPDYTVNTNSGPRNPKNSVKARIISNNMDMFIDDDDLRVFWPMFPGFDAPTPGEVVYVVFEDDTMTHGLWLSRVTLNGADDTKNQILRGQASQGLANQPKATYFGGTGGGSSDPNIKAPKDPYKLSRYFIDI